MSDFAAFFDADEGPAAADAPGGGFVSLRGKFLLAAPGLSGIEFARTVVLIIRHDAEGALGLVVNRQFGVTVEEACGEDVAAARGLKVPLFKAGPVEGPLMAIHNIEALAREEAALLAASESNPLGVEDHEPWSEAVAPGVWCCARREALEALMRHVRETLEAPAPPADGTPAPADAPAGSADAPAVKFVFNYAGWGPGQLESELGEGSWQVVEAAMAEVYAGGGSPQYAPPPPTTPLPAGAISAFTLLSQALEGAGDATAALAAGVRQWVRLITRANLRRLVGDRLIPPDPTVN